MFGWLCRATYCSVVSTLMLGVLHAIQNKKKLLNELDKKRPGTSQMSERFGPNFVPGSFALQQSIRLVYMLRALSRGRNRATRATRDNQHTHRQSTHTLGNGDTTQQPARDSEGELAAAAAAPPPPPPLLHLQHKSEKQKLPCTSWPHYNLCRNIL